MTKQYILQCKDAGELVITYDENQRFNALENQLQEPWEDKTLRYIFPRILTLDGLKALCTTDEWHKVFKMHELVGEIEFDAWYADYPRKDGSKDKAKKAWEKMSKIDRWHAQQWKSTYKNQLIRNPSQAVMHAVTYLNQKRWKD